LLPHLGEYKLFDMQKRRSWYETAELVHHLLIEMEKFRPL